mgnify:CR=1 FL=1
MKLPIEIQVALSGLIAMVVTEGVKVVFKKDLPELAKILTAGVLTTIFALSEYFLGLVPVEFQATVSAVFSLVISLFGAFGLHRMYKAAISKG